MRNATDHDPARRRFLGASAAGAAALAFPASVARGANETLNVGLIGVGGRCRALAVALVKVPDVRIAAVCDVYGPNLEHGQGDGRPEGVRLPELPGAARPQGPRRRPDRHARPLAHPDHRRRLPGGQGRVR